MDDNSKTNNPATPNPGDPSPQSDSSSSKADLSHFKPASAGEAPAPRQVSPKVMDSLSTTLDRAKKTALVVQNAASIIMADPKKLILGAGGLLLLILLIVIAVNVPTQISRSEAFSAYESGDYRLASEKFYDYLQDRPSDSEAMFYGALTSMELGNFEEAVTAMDRIANTPGISETPEFLFAHGLALSPRPDAVTPLNRLIQNFPGHVGGRLLRGVMLARQNETQRARADFLEADSTIRSGQYDSSLIHQVHNRISKNARNMLPEYDAEVIVSSDSEAMRSLSQNIGTPVFADAYINRYLPILPNIEDSGANIGDDGLIGMYYTIMLLNVGQFKEAQVEFSKLSTETMTASSAGALQGIMHALTGEYEQAKESLQALVSHLGKDPVLLFNLANANFMNNPTVEGAKESIALLDEALKDENFPEARHNRAFLRLLLGEVEGVEHDIAAVNEEFPQTKILKLLAELHKDPSAPEVDVILKSFDDKEQESLNWQYGGIVHNFSRGQYNKSLGSLRRIIGDGTEWTPVTALYADYLSAAGLLMRARHVWLTRGPQEDPETFYHLGRLAVRLDNVDEASKLLILMERTSDKKTAYADALRAIIAYYEGDKSSAETHIKVAIERAEQEVKQQIVVDSADMMFDIAPSDLREVLSSPVSPNASTNAVIARLKADSNDSDASSIARAAVTRRPYYDVQYHAGIALAEAGEFQDGIDTLQDASRWYPDNLPLLERIRDLQRQHNQGIEATETEAIIGNIRWFAESGNSADNQESLIIDAPAAENLGETITRVQQQVAHPQEAIDIYTSLIEEASSEDKNILHVQRASFLLSVGDYKGCEQDVRKALAGELPAERWRQAMLYLGRSLSEQKQFQKAFDTYERLIAEYPKIPLYRRLSGRALTNISPTDGIMYLTEVVRFFPADVETHFELINAYGKLQDVDGAVSVLQQAARILPTYLPIYGTLSRVQRFGDAQTAQENSIIADYLRKDS